MPIVSQASCSIPYVRFKDAQQQLANVVAIDYFFAKEMLTSGLNLELKLENNINDELLFHLLLALSESLREGHSCLPLSEIANHRYGFQCDHDNVVTHHGYSFPELTSLNNLLNQLQLSSDANQAVVYYEDKLFLRRYFNFEQEVIEFISKRCSTASSEAYLNENNQTNNEYNKSVAFCLNSLFPVSEIEKNSETDWQKIAVANALNKSFTIIAGGPGTGKTYTVTKLLAALITMAGNSALNISLVAPTGKAAQRLAESINAAVAGFSTLISPEILAAIPKEAQTIHRLLGVIPNSTNFRYNQNNKLSLDIVLIDEFSMVDLPLMTRVIRALPNNCQVILLGDADQLPSVAAGSVLADLAPYHQAHYSKENLSYLTQVSGDDQIAKAKKNTADHVTFLTKSRRFDGKGEIGLLAKAVIAGDNSLSWQLLEESKSKRNCQLTWIDNVSNLASYKLTTANKVSQADEINVTYDWLIKLVEHYYQPIKQCKSLAEAFSKFAQFRILAATRNGNAGVEYLNQFIESQINHTGKFNQLTIGNNNLYHGKPIMINQNDYHLGLYNGDIGFIWRNEAGHLMAVFQKTSTALLAANVEENYLWLLPSRLPSFETVYAMTIHKTQGSEFDHVAMVLPADTKSQILSRELLYTAITRAKSKLTIQSNRSVWRQGVESQVKRYSGITI